jgi:S-(hydroxymethyl)glutathione dehydrogenase / alcohol dehydrogenase
VGCGGIGLSAVNGAALAVASRIIAIDMVASKLEKAKEMGRHGHDQRIQCRCGRSGKRTRGWHRRTLFFRSDRPEEDRRAMLRHAASGHCRDDHGMIPFGTTIELHGADFLHDRKIQGASMGANPCHVDMPRLLELWPQGRLTLDTLVSGGPSWNRSI